MAIVGLMPAAGSATRMAGLPKALVPLNSGAGVTCPLWEMERRMASVCDRVLVGVADEYAPVARYAHHAEPVVVGDTATMSETVLKMMAGHVADSDMVVFGMPDTHWQQVNPWPVDDTQWINTFGLLSTQCLERDLGVAVAAFSVHGKQAQNFGLLILGGDQHVVVDVWDKPEKVADHYQGYAWGAMVWRSGRLLRGMLDAESPHIGYALADAAITLPTGQVQVAAMLDGYCDVGTLTGYQEALTYA